MVVNALRGRKKISLDREKKKTEALQDELDNLA